MIDATMSYEQRIYMLFAGIMTELQSAGLVQGGTPVTAKGKQVFKDLLAIGFHKQVSDDQIESLLRICKFLHNCNWIRDASDLHTFIGKHLGHCPEHSRIVIYDQNRFVLQFVHNLFKEQRHAIPQVV